MLTHKLPLTHTIPTAMLTQANANTHVPYCHANTHANANTQAHYRYANTLAPYRYAKTLAPYLMLTHKLTLTHKHPTASLYNGSLPPR